MDGRGRKHCPVTEGVGIWKGEVKNKNVCGKHCWTLDFWNWREGGGGTCRRSGINYGTSSCSREVAHEEMRSGTWNEMS